MVVRRSVYILFANCPRSPLRFHRLQSRPPPLSQPLDRLKHHLVGHFPAPRDPIPQIEIWQPELLAALNLPQHVVSAVAGGALIGVEEGVDRR